jgi:hypothetical protein
MPRILEMKTKNGELWVKVGNMDNMPSPIHLWTDEETKAFRLHCRAEFFREIEEKVSIS